MRGTGRIGFGVAAAVALAACTGGGSQLARGQLTEPTTASTSTTTLAPQGAAETTPTTVAVTTPPAPPTTAAPLVPIPTKQLKGPKTAAATARALTRIEHGLRGTNRDPAHLQKLGRAQQLAYRALAAHPPWVSEVIATVPSDVVDIVQSNLDAGAALNGVTSDAPPATGFPDWQILPPEDAATLRNYYTEAGQTYGIPWQYLAAIHFVETRMGRIHGNSTAGAQGPMQFIQSTWDAFGQGDINSNHDAIFAAAKYLQANEAATDIGAALFRYNNDERYAKAIEEYAKVMLADPAAYDGYYQWQVFYANSDGTFLLPEGWSAT